MFHYSVDELVCKRVVWSCLVLQVGTKRIATKLHSYIFVTDASLPLAAIYLTRAIFTSNNLNEREICT